MYTAADVAKRISELCQEKGINTNQLATISKVPASTIKNILNGTSQNPGIVTIKKLCDGIGVSLGEFFASEINNNLPKS